MHDPAVILARRTATDILLADGAIGVLCTWRGLASSDGAEVTIEWSPRVAAVDSPADRELLAEHFLGGVGATLNAAAIATHLERLIVAPLRRAIATHAVSTLLRGDADVTLSELIQTESKRAAFSVGLAILPPFVLRIESPSVERDRRLAETRTRLDAMSELNGSRARSLASLAQTLAELPDPRRAAQVLADLKLGDPLDLLRAVAIADQTWSQPTPALWIAAGDRLAMVDPTAPALNANAAITIDGIGPLRSVRGDSIDGQPVLLVGGRGGVAIVDENTRRVRAIYTCQTSSDFGFNGACVLTADRLLVATHSAIGLVTWPLDTPGGATVDAAGVSAGKACRSPLRCGARSVALIAEGRAAMFTPGEPLRVMESSPTDLAELERVDESTIVGLTSAGACFRVGCSAMDGEWSPLAVATRGGNSIASIDLCGTARVVSLTAEGGVRIVDPHGGPMLLVGAGRGAARLVRARPGFVATLSADRTRIALIDLARPDAIAAEIHVNVVLGNRVADCWFA